MNIVKVKTCRNLAVIVTFIMLVTPFIGWAATASLRASRSEVYSMGIVPYYVYGYDLKINTASVKSATKTPVVAPLLPIAGAGGASKYKLQK